MLDLVRVWRVGSVFDAVTRGRLWIAVMVLVEED